MIHEGANAGLAAAWARGRVGVRPKKLDAMTLALAKRLHADKQTDVATICQTLGICRSTFDRALKIKS